ncbi:tetratricopeptide repeat-containing sensor histidine kinase [Paraflavitalea soli]|nr:tetratricopeptide repeat protein [Paraflavitalea soli]
MKQRLLAVCLWWLWAYQAPAQTPYIDSLTQELKGSLADTSRAYSMMRLGIALETVDTALCSRTYNEGIQFASSKGLDYQAALLYFNRAYLYIARASYQEAEKTLDSALVFLGRSSHVNTLFKTASVYATLSEVKRHQGDYQQAVAWQNKAIELYIKLDKPASLLTAYINQASVFKDLNEFVKEEEYGRKALAIARSTGRRQDLFSAHFTIALALTMQNQYQKADDHIDSSRKYYDENYAHQAVISYHLVAGLIDMNLNRLASANEHFTKTGQIAEQAKDVFGNIQARLQLARVLTLQKKFREGEALLLAIQKERADLQMNHQVILLDYLARLYEEWGDAKKALPYYKKYKEVSDSMSSIQNKQYASNLEVQYQTAQKEATIQQLEADKKFQQLNIRQKNTLNYILIGGAVGLLVISLLTYRNYRHKQKLQQQRINELETEQQLTAAEAVLKGEEQERTRLAKDLHDGLGGMLSGIKYSLRTVKENLVMTPANALAFERSMDMLDSSIQEMRRVAHNMMPETLVKFGLDAALKDFCNDITQSNALQVTYQSIGMNGPDISQTTTITIYRIVQELINNAIKHAAARTSIVQISRTGDKVSLTVEDDGGGFDPAILQGTKGLGWSNIQNRVGYLKGNTDIRSEPGKGTSVLIEFETA